jgi:hypothetical protein
MLGKGDAIEAVKDQERHTRFHRAKAVPERVVPLVRHFAVVKYIDL